MTLTENKHIDSVQDKHNKCKGCSNSLATFYLNKALAEGKKISIPSLDITIMPDTDETFSSTENIPAL